MDFVKMQGIGNDFVLVDCTDARVAPETVQAAAVKLCDRRFGIGSDGILVVCPSDTAPLRMRMFNPDGTEGMCGNGLRCFVKYAYERGLVRDTSFSVETVGGTVRVELSLDSVSTDGEACVTSVRADMGKPRLLREQIPMLGLEGEQVVNEVLSVGQDRFEVTCASMGNPHCIIFVPDVDAVPLEDWGPQLEHHPVFPQRANIEFVEVVNPGVLRVRVWERGAGVTLACGTGACASVVAGVLAERCDRRCAVNLPGGTLDIEWADDDHVMMAGPAETVFVGSVDL